MASAARLWPPQGRGFSTCHHQVQCFMYDWYKLFTKPASALDDGMGEACMEHLERLHAALGPPSAPKPPTVLLGPTYPPAWVDAYSNRTNEGSIMSRIFGSVNRAAGIECVRRGGEYSIRNSKSLLGPVDRYNIVGHRKADRIHPMPNAQRAILLMMARHLCTGKHGKEE